MQLSSTVRALCSLFAAQLVFACSTDEGCSLNGVCIKHTSTCKCDPGWKGDDCGQLDLRTAKRNNGYNWTEYTSPSYLGSSGNSSWGATILQDQRDRKKFHLFTSQFSFGCGLSGWIPDSEVIRAESYTGPQGPYYYKQSIGGRWRHNPYIFWSPADKEYLLYGIGTDYDATPKCGWVDLPYAIQVAHSKNLEGPWSNFTTIMTNETNPSPYDLTNPAPWPLWTEENPTSAIALATWGNPIYVAPRFDSHYSLVKWQPWNTTVYESLYWTEDPFLWRDKRGNWHILVHWMKDLVDYGKGVRSPNVGAHLFSRTLEGNWTFKLQTAFTSLVPYDDGSSIDYYRRERPKLFFSQDGQMTPLYLSTGVQEHGANKTGKTYTVIQPIGEGAARFEKSMGC